MAGSLWGLYKMLESVCVQLVGQLLMKWGTFLACHMTKLMEVRPDIVSLSDASHVMMCRGV